MSAAPLGCDAVNELAIGLPAGSQLALAARRPPRLPLPLLRAQGRMVGLISHVAELAERVPVRFVVDKVGTSATVERVDQ